ncbi:MAG: hypothetical protein LBP63_10800 [Prevotellaceae bacterium]|jgi:hypothetical protein|nr:hypothetical protein [Prevotellaceae bacterium]
MGTFNNPYIKAEFEKYKKEHPFKGFLLDVWGVFVTILYFALILGFFYWLFFIS